ncbi:TlpA family protein disulfide reductase [Sphingobacterium faecale]|uniref:TlpA family protein disulfide reductase n=1 Tax=Sphingobacterium faecale TaxID=2803775 RepID=A0ABS1R1L7_9SPHI|nr:TlpA disulfide reductase family protein [Sphingobacterium faecale]MBL1408205.1 TlpA family protein disulfide reductase [Sphingobacterium faecale]
MDANNETFSHSMAIKDDYTLGRLVLSENIMTNMKQYQNAIIAKKINITTEVFEFMIDTNSISLNLDITSNSLRQTGGKMSSQFQEDRALNVEYLRLHREKKMLLSELNFWRMKEKNNLILKHIESPYSVVLFRELLMVYDDRMINSVKSTLHALTTFHNTDEINRLRTRLDQFIRDNEKKDSIPMPPFELISTFDQRRVSNILDEYDSVLLIIDWWATWCAPCIAQHPEYFALSKRFEADKRINFISISVDKRNEDVIRYLKKSPLPIDSYWMTSAFTENLNYLNKSIGIYSIPKYMIIDVKQKLIIRIENLKNLETAIQKHLNN